ncbi:MAG: winged helix-turn-helix domain-containing protein [Bacteroidota bacterium]
MDPSPALDTPFAIGEWTLHPVFNTASGNGQSTSVEPRVMGVLVYLAHRAGEVISRDELLDNVWAGVVVNEDALTRAVSEVRKLFGDDPRAPKVIETVRGRGYRLIAPVKFDEPEPVAPAQEALPALPGTSRDGAWWVGVAGLVTVALALGIGAGVWVGREDPSAPQPSLMEAVPVTSYPGREVEPAISPEGARVAFAWDGGEGNNFDLYVKQSSREQAVQLTDSPAFEGTPAWSPDGSEIAFVRGGEQAGIYTIPSMGGTERLVVETSDLVSALDWSPDGQTLVFTAPFAEGAPSELRLVDLSTGEVRALTSPPGVRQRDRTPRFSPDGRRVAFVRGGGGSPRTVYLVDLASGIESIAPGNPTGVRDVDWLDERALVLSSYRAGSYDLWRYDLGTGEMTWIPSRGEWSYYPSVASQTGDLVFQDLYFEKDVWRIRLDAPGGQVLGTEPIITSTWFDCEADISPDQTRIAFVSSRSGTMELWVSDADGQDPVQLSSFDGSAVGAPRWSPSGDLIALNASPNGNASVYIVDVNAGRSRLLTPADWNARLSGWTSDGTGVYFSTRRSGTWELWYMPLAGGEPQQVTQHNALYGRASSDGQWLYFARADQAGLWRISLENRSATQDAELVTDALAFRDALNWALSDAGLYALDRTPDGLVVTFLDFETGETRVVSEVVRLASPSLAVSRDGKTLIYGRVENARSDLRRLVQG